MLTTLEEVKANSHQSSGKEEHPGDMEKVLSSTQPYRSIRPENCKAAVINSNHSCRFFFIWGFVGFVFVVVFWDFLGGTEGEEVVGFFLKTLYIIIISEELLNLNYTIRNGQQDFFKTEKAKYMVMLLCKTKHHHAAQKVFKCLFSPP